MKKVILAITIMFACFAIIGGSVGIKEAKATIKHRGIKFTSVETVGSHQSGIMLYKGILEGNQKIKGKIFKGGTRFEFSPDFKILEGFLKEKQKVSNLGGGIYYRGDYPYSNVNGVQCGFLENGITWKNITFQSKAEFCFETVRDCIPVGSDINCEGQKDVPVSGFLAKDTAIPMHSLLISFVGTLDVTVKKGTEIVFENDSSGLYSRPISFTPAQDFEYQGTLYSAGETLEYPF